MPSTLSSEIAFLESQLSVGIVFGNQSIFSSSSSVPNNQTYLQLISLGLGEHLKESMDFTQEIPWVFPWVFQLGFPLEGFTRFHQSAWSEQPSDHIIVGPWHLRPGGLSAMTVVAIFPGIFPFPERKMFGYNSQMNRSLSASFIKKPRNSRTHPPKRALKAASSC